MELRRPCNFLLIPSTMPYTAKNKDGPELQSHILPQHETQQCSALLKNYLSRWKPRSAGKPKALGVPRRERPGGLTLCHVGLEDGGGRWQVAIQPYRGGHSQILISLSCGLWSISAPRGFVEACFLQRMLPSETTGIDCCKQEGCCIFGRKRLESCSLLPTRQHMGICNARSKGCLELKVEKGVTDTADMA